MMNNVGFGILAGVLLTGAFYPDLFWSFIALIGEGIASAIAHWQM